jgi:D-alanyl-D-alanine carboxypeptidase/D-alanyl-D-alanine-endopeptidase (penicillin-binding protein 4)
LTTSPISEVYGSVGRPGRNEVQAFGQRTFRRGVLLCTPEMPRVLATLLALAAMLAGAQTARAYDAGDLASSLTRQMRLAPPTSGIAVRDLDSGSELFALRPATPRVPASVEKLYTTATTLLAFGPNATLDTRVLSRTAVGAEGVLHGNLVLAGGGDPFFGEAAAARLARKVKAAGVARIDGAVVGDETAFDRLRSGWGIAYDPDLGGVLSALAYDRGFYGGRLQLDSGRFAATRFAAQLTAIGVRSSAVPRAGAAPEDAVAIATEPSQDVRTLIGLVNVPSNNFAAEMLLKNVGMHFGDGGSTRGGALVVRRKMAELGLHPTIADGSGLSRSDRTSPREVVGLLARMDEPDVGDAFRSSLALAGRTGTVARRMRGTSASGRCRLKTGTLSTVSALAGYCRTRGGRDLAFAVLMNRVYDFAGAHATQDRIAAAIAQLDGTADTSPDSPSAGAGAGGAPAALSRRAARR